MTIADYADYDGLGLAQLVRNKDVKPSELIEEAIARAEKLNPKLNCVVFEAYDQARAAAKGDVPDGVFEGVPFLLKDIFAFAEGMPTRLAAGFVPPVPATHDSLLTRRYKSAGLIMLGKTNTSEFGLVPTTESKLYGPALNPWNLDYSPGGSSGGSAAAVAARIVPLAHANDGGGSIRTPASCCGLVGLKPTRGRMSYAPDYGDVLDGFANDHVVSRSVRDSAAALDATAGCIEGDPYWAPEPPRSYLAALTNAPKRLRVAFSTQGINGRTLHPDCIAAIESAAKFCEDLGHIVEEAAPDLNEAALIPAFMTFWSAHLAAAIDHVAHLTGQKPSPDHFEGLTWGLYESGKRVTASEYLLCKGAMQMAARRAAAFHRHHDVWLSSTLGSPPAKIGSFDLNERDPRKSFAPLIDYVQHTALQNVTGQPAITLPLHWNAAGLPIGAHFVGRFGDELTLLQLGAQLEQLAPWAKRRPALVA